MLGTARDNSYDNVTNHMKHAQFKNRTQLLHERKNYTQVWIHIVQKQTGKHMSPQGQDTYRKIS